jgi:hypothetical protein
MKLFILMILFVLLTGVSAAYQESLGRELTLRTSYDPDRYALLTAEGNTIYAEGFFLDDTVEDFYISPAPRNASSSFSRSADGSFIAAFSGIPSESNALAVIVLDNGTTLNYRIEYDSDNGWFFGDNGLAARTSAALGNYRVIPPEISENYISASLCLAEITETRAVLLQIAAEVTDGLGCDYQKAKALSRWVADNIVYDRDARDSEVTEETVSIATTLRLRRSVCIGIANTYAALLEAAGIKALNIKGGIANPHESVPYELLPTETIVHEWVAFWFENGQRWVYTDPTWDRQGFFENGNYHHRASVMKYFDISPLALSFDHRGDTAELREYFALPQLTIDNEPHAGDDGNRPEIPDGLPSVPTEPEPPPLSPSPNEEFGFLYMTIGVLILAAVIMVIIILKYRK